MRRIAAGIAPYFVVFSASACGLIIEIVASRLLAPMVGVSLFTWTSIIGVVLAGISLGNYLGGVLADRYPSPKTLGIILLGAGLTSLAVLPMLALVSGLYDSLHILARIVLITSTLFLAPSLILGMVTPVVIKLRLQSLAQTGNVVGKIYALSTGGKHLRRVHHRLRADPVDWDAPDTAWGCRVSGSHGNRVRQSVAHACCCRRSVGTLRGHRRHGHSRGFTRIRVPGGKQLLLPLRSGNAR